MASFVHVEYPQEHPGVVRAERALEAVRGLGSGFDGARGLAALLLGALVAAVVVVADQMIDTWADGHLMAAWVVLWLVGFASIGLFAGTARSIASRVVAAGNRWAAARALQRADERLWALAQTDSRVMTDLRVAHSRSTQSDVEATPVSMKTPRGVSYYI